MNFAAFHFAKPFWFFLLIVIPVIWVLAFCFDQRKNFRFLEQVIDKHLLPYLLVNEKRRGGFWKPLLLFSFAWTCLTLAMAEPRWSFQEIETFSKDQSLVILLDLSKSMDATDVKPTRLVRAKQHVEDILSGAKKLRIGLIAFAADPHMITPLTDDVETVRHLLPSLETSLMHVQGSRLTPALHMSSQLLQAVAGENKAILVISDGGFEDFSAMSLAKTLHQRGIVVHTMGVGTEEGSPIPDQKGNFIKKRNDLILSKLDKEKLGAVAKAGKGFYLDGDFSTDAVKHLLDELDRKADVETKLREKVRVWKEHFYLFLIPAMIALLLWFRRGTCLFCFLCLMGVSLQAHASGFSDYFFNQEELGAKAFKAGDYETAKEVFEDPYRKGVAHYRANELEKAEMYFRQSTRPEVEKDAAYNLGTTLAGLEKLEESIQVYEELLKKWPDHQKAKENLEIVKKMLKEKKKEPPPSEEKERQNKEKSDDSGKENEEGNRSNGNEGDEDQAEGESAGEKDSGQTPPKLNEDSQSEENHQSTENPAEEEQPSDDKDFENPNHSFDEESKEKAPSAQMEKTEKEFNANSWLNQLQPDTKTFLKNKFYIESMRSNTKEAVDPW